MFKKIYYINLEHRTDRREHVEKEIKKINFNGPVERVNGAFGKNLDLSLVPSNLFTNDAIKSTTNKADISNTSTMTKGGMGVALSQKWVYEKILCGQKLIREWSLDLLLSNLDRTVLDSHHHLTLFTDRLFW